MTDGVKRDGGQRLAKVSGQVNALQRLVSEDRPCLEVLQQISSARAALEQVSILFLTEHLRTCVLHQDGSATQSCCDGLSGEAQGEAIKTALKRFVKS